MEMISSWKKTSSLKSSAKPASSTTSPDIIKHKSTAKVLKKETIRVGLTQPISAYNKASTFSQIPLRANYIENLTYEENEDAVCPYSILNKSGFKIFIKKKRIGGGQGYAYPGQGYGYSHQKLVLLNNEELNITADYAETDTLKQNLFMIKERKPVVPSHVYDIEFKHELGFLPVQNVNLDAVGLTIHQLFPPEDDLYGQHSLAYLICSITLNKMRKLLTIRTPYMIINKTNARYKLTFLNLREDENDEEIFIDPDESFYVPLECMNCELVISNPPKDKTYSQKLSLAYIVPFLSKQKTVSFFIFLIIVV